MGIRSYFRFFLYSTTSCTEIFIYMAVLVIRVSFRRRFAYQVCTVRNRLFRSPLCIDERRTSPCAQQTVVAKRATQSSHRALVCSLSLSLL